MSLAGELRKVADRLSTPGAKEARKLRVPLDLYRLYRRLGDPSPDMVAFAQGGGVPSAAVHGPPSTPEDWEQWWERVRDTVR